MAKETKENRMAEGRSAERRESEMRTIMNMNYQDTLYVPEDVIPKGYEYRWGTISVLGTPRPNRMIELKRKGWEPVPAERHPELAFTEFFESNSQMRGHIWRDGLVLVERPTEYGDIERAQLAKLNNQLLNSMPGTENFLGEPSIPTSFVNDTQTKVASFGR